MVNFIFTFVFLFILLWFVGGFIFEDIFGILALVAFLLSAIIHMYLNFKDRISELEQRLDLLENNKNEE